MTPASAPPPIQASTRAQTSVETSARIPAPTPAPTPALRFLPGMMCDERLFTPQLDHGFLGNNASVASFDQAGSIEAMAEEALRTATDEGLVLVGLSMGGIVAMECVRQAPDRVRALVLMDTNPLSEPPDRQSLRGPQIGRVLAGELESVLIDEMKPLYLAPANRDDELLLALVLNMATSLGEAAFVRQSQALARRRDYSDTLRHWQGPTLILCGEHDSLCPPDRHRYLHRLMPHAELHLIADAGHLPKLEAAEMTNRFLQDFVSRLS